jgi:sodium transport system permease protein
MKSILTVYWKEVTENLRDRRTVINTLLTGPLFAPLIFVLLINTMITRELDKAEKPLPLPVAGAENAPNLIEALKQARVDIQTAAADPELSVREQDVDMVLRIPPQFGASWSRGEPAQIEIIYDQSRRDASSTIARLRSLLEHYDNRSGALRMVARGLSPSVAHPIVIAERDQSTSQSRAGTLFSMLPYFFVLGGFVGGMALAIDTTAGERERQSLEPLFANPVARWRILLGKLAATTTFAIVTVLLSILAFSIVGRLMPTEKIGMSLSIGLPFIAKTMLVMLPLTALLATLQTLVAAFAKSYREAQTYVSLLMFVPVIPTLMLTVMPFKTVFWMYAVPLMSQQIIVTRLLRGDYVAPSALAVCFACTTLTLLLLYGIATRVYYSERLAISA